MKTNLLPENLILKVWQKEKTNIFDYYFEFMVDSNITEVDMIVCEQYYMKKIVEVYYQNQPEYCTTSKFFIPISREIRSKIIQYYENPKLIFLFD